MSVNHVAPNTGEEARVQLRVVGAVVLRELHTRFGRNNIGYLWLVVEPMILSFGVSIFHLFTHISLPFGFDPGPFYATGYITFILYRNNVGRAASLIESNKPLLYHRIVTLIDVSVARSFLEFLATFGALVVMILVYSGLGVGHLPERPWLMLAALLLMAWISTAVAMIVTAAGEFSSLTERLIHPLNYLMLPFTGMFFILDELPPKYASALSWFPLPQITDLARMGLKAEFNSTYLNVPYIMGVAAFLTVIGLSALRLARRRMHFE